MKFRIYRVMIAAGPALALVYMAACSSDDTVAPRPPNGADAQTDVAPRLDAPADTTRDADPTDAGQDGERADAAHDADTADAGQDVETTDAGQDGEGGSADPPHVTASDPREGAADVYPVEVYDQGSGLGVGERKRITVSFDAAMDTASTRAELTPSAGPARTIDGVWEPDRRRIVFTLVPPDPNDPNSHPLDENTSYRLDLRALRDPSGRPLDPAHASLGDGVLDFATGSNDSLLNHACQHSLYGPYTNVAATSSATGAPNTSQTHREYTVTLPSAGSSSEGFTRFRFGGENEPADYVFYFGSLVPLQIRNETAGAPIALSAEGETPPACPGITHFGRFTVGRTNQHSAKFGPISQPSFKFIIEAI